MKTAGRYAIRIFLFLFLGYTLYLIIWLFVLNKTSLTSGYIHHSENISEAKYKGTFAGQYLLSKADPIHIPYLPKSIFIEQETIFYPHYFFYFGKTEKGDRFTVNVGSFDRLNAIQEFNISSPKSTLPNETTNITAKPLYFFFNSAEDELTFLLSDKNDDQVVDTITYKRQL